MIAQEYAFTPPYLGKGPMLNMISGPIVDSLSTTPLLLIHSVSRHGTPCSLQYSGRGFPAETALGSVIAIESTSCGVSVMIFRQSTAILPLPIRTSFFMFTHAEYSRIAQQVGGAPRCCNDDFNNQLGIMCVGCADDDASHHFPLSSCNSFWRSVLPLLFSGRCSMLVTPEGIM